MVKDAHTRGCEDISGNGVGLLEVNDIALSWRHHITAGIGRFCPTEMTRKSVRKMTWHTHLRVVPAGLKYVIFETFLGNFGPA